MAGNLSIKKRVVLTVIGIVIVSTAGIAMLSYQMQMGQLKETVGDLAKSEGMLFRSIIGADAEGLARAHIGLTRLDRILAPFAAGKRDDLLAAAKPVFDDMKSRNNITHMYFINSDGTVLLRVHKPEQAGDKLARATFKEAAASGKLSSGLEMGKNFFSLRSVHPVTYGAFHGFLEVAQEIDHVFHQMKETTGNEVSVFLSSDYLAGKKAEVGDKKVRDFTLLDSTDEKSALLLAAKFPVLEKGLKESVVSIVTLGSKKYAVAASPLSDAAGQTAGILFSQRDVTPLFAGLWQGILVNCLLFAVILIVSVAVLYLSMRNSLVLFDAVKDHILRIAVSKDLTGRLAVTTSDEVGELAGSVNVMSESLNRMVRDIRDTAGAVAEAAAGIKERTSGLSTGSHAQANAAEETSGTMAEMAASIETVARNAGALAGGADVAASSVAQLGTSSEQVARNAGNMAHAVDEASANLEKIAGSIDTVAGNAESLASSVSSTAATIEEMAVSVDRVAANADDLQQVVEEASVTIREMALTIKEVAGKVGEADSLAKTASGEGEAGLAAGRDAVAAMEKVAGVIQKTSASIENLGRRSEEIGSIISVINEISDQTNLLALNAAIEAARAGDSGRGFAVVAEEIRKLAERSMAATGEIAEVIRQVRSDTEESVRHGEVASAEARTSMTLSRTAGKALESIVGSIVTTSTVMSEIARITAEQSQASELVNRAVEKIGSATVEMAGAAREQAVGSRRIRSAVEEMTGMTAEVASTARAQARGSVQIREAVERMRDLTREVADATREQALSARQLASAVTGMNEMTQSVANATAEQKKGGELILGAVQNISDIARQNLTSVEGLAGDAENLAGRAVALAELVAAFRVEQS